MIKFYMCDLEEQHCYAVNEEDLLEAIAYAQQAVRGFPKLHIAIMLVKAKQLKDEDEDWTKDYEVVEGKIKVGQEHIHIGYHEYEGKGYIYANISDYYTDYIGLEELLPKLSISKGEL
ncbi:MAG: hypothetical protein QXS54_12200 [Candidatus Methanomethylicaceae archaeon]